VTFAPLDSRKQQLCRQLLATLSRWRSELAPAMAVGLGGGSPHHQVVNYRRDPRFSPQPAAPIL